MNHAWRLSTRLIVTLFCLMLGLIGVFWVFNSVFLERYYRYNKQRELVRGYQTIDEAAQEGVLYEDSFDVTFDTICSNGNIDILVTENETVDDTSYRMRSSFDINRMYQMTLAEFFYGPNQSDPQTLTEKENYVIERRDDRRMETGYLILTGTLSDKETRIFMRTPLESIRESAQITNNFFLMVSAGTMILFVGVIILVARSISHPIMELTKISKRMCNLDFDAKYVPTGRTTLEISVLGQHMNELSDTLEKTIRDLKVANLELTQDIEKKEAIDEMRKEFLSNVSHELKTPLALISGYAEGLREGINDDAESREFYCEVIEDETNKMSRMVQKLLTLNQLEFGNDVPEMSRFDMTALVRDAIAASRLLLESEDIRLTFTEEPVYVWADQFKIEEVITNYLSNAIHYAVGEKRIRIFYEEKGDLLRVYGRLKLGLMGKDFTLEAVGFEKAGGSG